MAPEAQAAPRSAAFSKSRLRAVLLGTLGVGVIGALILFAYELALARVPQHRAALERLVRAQTGLDVRFSELGLRWGWYGPEAVFRHVELDEPGSAEALLRAPELVVGFDAWRTLRSGHPEAGRIELVAPDIDFSSRRGSSTEVARKGVGGAAERAGSATPEAGSSAIGRVAVLQRWRGGRIDLEGGTLRLPDPAGTANPFTIQIRRASLRRSEDEWSVAGLVFLPDRVGRTARVVLRVNGDLGEPAALGGSLHLEGRRLLFPGCRDFLAGLPGLARALPRGGTGDATLDLDFQHGQLLKANGTVRASGLVFEAPASGSVPSNLLALDRLQGNWHARRQGSGWRIRVDSLDLVKGERPAALTLETGESVLQRSPGRWMRGSLEQAPLESVLAVARWLAPQLDLAGIQLDGTARNVTFDWASARPDGEKLRASARLEDVVLVPRSRNFTLSGLGVRVSGNESQLTFDVQSRTARLELAQSQQNPLADVHVASTLRVSTTRDGWQIATDEFLLEHQRASLSLSGTLEGGSFHEGVLSSAAVRGNGVQPSRDSVSEPRISATGILSGADIPLVERLLGENTAQAFGAVASRLTAGRIQNAEFALHGPIGELPFDVGGDGFTGSLTLRGAVISGGDLWPDAEGIDARVEWRGARIQANIETGRAGAFQLAAARAQWDATGRSATRLTGHVIGRLEDAIAWVHEHPRLQEYAPAVRDVDASGDASFDFNVSVPAIEDTDGREPQVAARVSTFVDGATVQGVSGLPPVEGVTGSLVFDSGRLQRSTLTGSWLGGPVALRVGERHEKGARVFAVQVQGTLKAQQVANLANAAGSAHGSADWTGELAYLQADGSQPSHWRMRADSSLLGVASSLPEPFAKRSAAPVPVHLEVAGTSDAAQMRADFGDRLRSVFTLRRLPDVGWAVERGAVRFGTGVPVLPSEPVVMVRGRVSQLDLPAYAMAWQRLRHDSLPAIRAQMVADGMLVGGRRYDEVSVQAERTEAGTDLLIDSAALAGTVRWPAPVGAGRGRAGTIEVQPAELHLTRLDLPDGAPADEGIGLMGALAPTALVSVDELNWRGRSLGRLTARLASDDGVVVVEDAHLVNGTHDARGALRCQTALPMCRLSFKVDSTDAAATLTAFGFTPDLGANEAALSGDVEWRPTQEQPWLAGLRGTLSMRLADGTLRGWQRPSGVAGWAGDGMHPGAADGVPGRAAEDAVGGPQGRAGDGAQGGDGNVAAVETVADAGRPPPFALLAVPALVGGLDAPGAPGAPLTQQRELHFEHLGADFELRDGQATTTNLHFDGDAEILMRGRTGLVSRDYDLQVWVLRGEDRLPAAVRRFGATPRVAAAWLSLRDLFAGSGSQDRSRAVMRLQGSWDDPMVVAEN